MIPAAATKLDATIAGPLATYSVTPIATRRHRRGWRLIVASVWGVVAISMTVNSRPRNPEIWLAPMQPTQRPDGARAGAADYGALFSPAAPWSSVAKHLSAFKIYPDLLRDASDDDVRHLIDGLAARHIALALETPVLVSTGWCVTGIKQRPWMVTLVGRLKQLGGNLQYLAMVGPLVDGHTSTKPNACHRPIPEVAADAARTIKAIRKFYPNLQVGEIEPIGYGPNYPNWYELGVWFEAFKAASGRPLAFLHMDTGWEQPWQQDMLDVARQTRAAGIQFGVIYNGDLNDLSNTAFARDALRHADALEALLGGPPDQIVFQSWVNYPSRALPEDDPSTMTGIVLAYLRPYSRLDIAARGRLRLRQEGGAPIAGAQVGLQVNDPMSEHSLQLEMIEGIVPHGASSVRFALRVHAECTCPQRDARLSLAGFDFHQASAPPQESHWDLRPWATQWVGVLSETMLDGVPVLRVTTAATQRVVLNGPTIPVIQDQPFTARFSWQVEPSADGTGFAALIFLGPDGVEHWRTWQTLHTTWRTIAEIITEADGTAALPFIVPEAGATMRLIYAGDLTHRGTELTLDVDRASLP